MGYARSPFRDFESYLRIVVGLDEEDIRLILKQYNEKLATHEISPGFYSIKGVAKVLYTKGGYAGTQKIEYDDITKKTKLIIKRFGSIFGTLRFDERSKIFKYFFRFHTLLG